MKDKDIVSRIKLFCIGGKNAAEKRKAVNTSTIAGDIDVGRIQAFDEVLSHIAACENSGIDAGGLKTAQDFKKVADAAKNANNLNALDKAVRANIEFLEGAISHAAHGGSYSVQSDNLLSTRWGAGSSYSESEMCELLVEALRVHFEALGFKCTKDTTSDRCVRLVVSWQ